MEQVSRIWFTPRQRAELWERWRSGQCVADIARAVRTARVITAASAITTPCTACRSVRFN